MDGHGFGRSGSGTSLGMGLPELRCFCRRRYRNPTLHRKEAGSQDGGREYVRLEKEDPAFSAFDCFADAGLRAGGGGAELSFYDQNDGFRTPEAKCVQKRHDSGDGAGRRADRGAGEGDRLLQGEVQRDHRICTERLCEHGRGRHGRCDGRTHGDRERVSLYDRNQGEGESPGQPLRTG